jgi:putative phage-type endonuclease
MIDLSIRSTGIGASEAAAALGVDPYKSSFALWCEKVGDLEPADLSDVEAVEWGNRLEPVVSQAFADRTQRIVEHNEEQVTERSEEYPFMLATLDSIQICPKHFGYGALEIKVTNAYLAGEWDDGPPLRAQIQLQHQLAVADLEWGSVAGLIGGNRLVWYDMDRHEDFITAMIAKEAAFWESVEKRIKPPVDGSEATAAAIRALYSTANGESVHLPCEATEWDHELVACKARIKAEEGVKKELETRKAAIGEAEFGVLPSGERYKWGTIERNEPAREARTITYRELRRLKK